MNKSYHINLPNQQKRKTTGSDQVLILDKMVSGGVEMVLIVESAKQDVQLVQLVLLVGTKDLRDVVSLLIGCDESGSGFTNEKTGSGFRVHGWRRALTKMFN